MKPPSARLFHKSLGKPKGFALLVIPFLILAMTNVALFTMTFFIQKQRERTRIEKASSVLEETTISSFTLMEAALRRRMWEPPPDDQCLRAENFRVYGTTEQGIEWEVTGTFDPKLRAYDLYATGKFAQKVVKFKKQIKVMDTSDYLIVSTSTKDFTLVRGADKKRTSGLIAGDRQIIINGPIRLRNTTVGQTAATTTTPSWATPRGTVYPGDYGMIIQAERISALGGISYEESTSDFPTPNEAMANTMIGPYITDSGSPSAVPPVPAGQKFVGMNSYSPAVITRDKTLALNLKSDVEKGTSNLAESVVMKNAYPAALFNSGSTFPYIANTGVDTGSYLSNTHSWYELFYTYSLARKGVRSNVTCLAQTRATPNVVPSDRKQCSYSKDFPKGFATWRTDADLDGVLLTGAETSTISISKIDWDNLQSLKEDAEACGVVVADANTAVSYEDCPIWDYNSLITYEKTADMNCQLVRKVNLSSASFNKFDPTDYTDDSKADRLLRRVIYSDLPIELTQSDAKGLRPGFSDPVARTRLAVWVVGEDLINLRGFQKDQSDPRLDAVQKVREVTFNKDLSTTSDTAPMGPLNLVLLTPEKIHLISPDYVPMSKDHMKIAYPVVDGRIVPRHPNLTDYTRYEDDAYLYGTRDFYINNVAIITNPNVVSTPFPAGYQSRWATLDNTSSFFLKGMWAPFPWNGDVNLNNLCLMNNYVTDPDSYVPFSLPKVVAALPPGSYDNWEIPVPAYSEDADSVIPPKSSNYYLHESAAGAILGVSDVNYQDPATERKIFSSTKSFVPYAFELLAKTDPARAYSSNVTLKGIRLLIDFDSTVPTGKRSLQNPIYTPLQRYKMDLSNRKYLNDYTVAPLNTQNAIMTNMKPTSPNGRICQTETTMSDNIAPAAAGDGFFDSPAANKTLAAVMLKLDNHNLYLDNQPNWNLNMVTVNHGAHQFLQESPDEKFRGLGSLNGIEFPVLEVGE